jgi:hypothetical protein
MSKYLELVLFLLLKIDLWVRVIVFNSTFNNISILSWQSVLLVEENGVHREKHGSATNHWQTL